MRLLATGSHMWCRTVASSQVDSWKLLLESHQCSNCAGSVLLMSVSYIAIGILALLRIHMLQCLLQLKHQ